MQEYLSRLDYMDGLGTLQQRAAYRHEVEQAYLQQEARHEIRVVLRRRRTLARKAKLKRFGINVLVGVALAITLVVVLNSILNLSAYLMKVLP